MGRVLVAPVHVRQSEISALVKLRGQIHRMQCKYNNDAGVVLDRLLAGCSVESGRHRAKVRRNNSGPAHTIELEVL